MKRLNRIVCVLTLVFAVSILVLGVLLSKKNDQLLDRGNRMAAAIEKASTILDDRENAATPWDGDVRQKETNGLNLRRQLDLFIAQARDIIQQRNSLGDTLSGVASKLCLPEVFDRRQFHSAKSHAERSRRLVEFSETVTRRDELLVDYFIRIGDKIKKQVAADLRERSRGLMFDDMTAVLDKLVEDVEMLKRRSDSYAQHHRRDGPDHRRGGSPWAGRVARKGLCGSPEPGGTTRQGIQGEAG